jgi:hypothetical protein
MGRKEIPLRLKGKGSGFIKLSSSLARSGSDRLVGSAYLKRGLLARANENPSGAVNPLLRGREEIIIGRHRLVWWLMTVRWSQLCGVGRDGALQFLNRPAKLGKAQFRPWFSQSTSSSGNSVDMDLDFLYQLSQLRARTPSTRKYGCRDGNT